MIPHKTTSTHRSLLGGQFWEWSANEVQIWPLPPWDIKRRLHLLWSLYIVSLYTLLQKWGRNCKTIHIPGPVMLLLLLGVKLRFIPMKVDIWQCSYVVTTHETIIILTSNNIFSHILILLLFCNTVINNSINNRGHFVHSETSVISTDYLETNVMNKKYSQNY